MSSLVQIKAIGRGLPSARILRMPSGPLAMSRLSTLTKCGGRTAMPQMAEGAAHQCISSCRSHRTCWLDGQRAASVLQPSRYVGGGRNAPVRGNCRQYSALNNYNRASLDGSNSET
jgi:hypothetical protein